MAGAHRGSPLKGMSSIPTRVALTVSEQAEVLEHAVRERRSYMNMVGVLVSEALAERRRRDGNGSEGPVGTR